VTGELPKENAMRVGVFGGSFDPVHLGHLWIAEAAIEALDLSELRWMPAAQSPLKSSGPIASDSQRLIMLGLALSGAEHHVIDDRELRRGGVSYTVDTVIEMQQELKSAELFLIIGSDSLSTIRQWHRPTELLMRIIPAVVRRGGDPVPDYSLLSGLIDDDRLARTRDSTIEMPLIEISSSDLRQRMADRKSIRFRTPRAVEAFIHAERLYLDKV
jgi:nicotinate-nucleotide adenylyltransferase